MKLSKEQIEDISFNEDICTEDAAMLVRQATDIEDFYEILQEFKENM